MAQKRKTRQKVSKGYTLSQFRAWLEGVEEMQNMEEGDWSPNLQQWKLIRQRIADLVPDVEVKETVHVVTAETANGAVGGFTGQGRVESPTVTGPAPVVKRSSLPDPAQQNTVRSLAPVVDESQKAPVARSEREHVKTPTIDTSQGEYTSAFA